MSLLPPSLDPTDIAAIRARLDDAGTDRRPIGLRTIDLGPDAIAALPRRVREARGDRLGDIVVLTDATPIARGSGDLKADAVARLRDAPDPADAPPEPAAPSVRHVVLGRDRPELHADEAAIAEADREIDGAAVVVSIGSGTVTDIAKDASHRAGVPFVVVQTAVSVNAFSDDMAVLLRNGVKRTVPSGWPAALIVDLAVIADAPAAMNQAGFGELMAMFTAPADWYLARAVGADESYDEGVVRLFRDGAGRLLDQAAGVAAVRHDALAELAGQMTLTGIAMGVAGRTAPLSGTEHTISHLLDMAAAADGRGTAFHGAQVGVASVVVALAWRRVLRDLDPMRIARGRSAAAASSAARARVAAAFDRLDRTGRATEECWTDYRRKTERWSAADDVRGAFAARWPEHHAALTDLLLAPEALVDGLRTAGAPTRFSELDPPIPPDSARWAVASCHLMRDRFTVADLVELSDGLGRRWDEAFADDLLAEAAALGAGL
ncbi:MAG TPA: iron-containing alcohol dehydrogenase [Candidatus Limnocylindrales bacterium]|nr:iron-containing alcohol dehydrogenase [Candidatus Limnocylindrales bacterium]